MLSNIWVYKKTSKVMISLLLAAVLVLATQNWLLGLLMFIVTAAAVVWVKRSDLMQERLLMRYLDDLSSGVSVGTVYAVRNLPLGIAVVDEKKKLVWANGVFRSWIAGTEEGTHKWVPSDEPDGASFMVLYFMDRSDVEKSLKESEEARPVFCLIRIDNIQEVTAEMSDVERSALLSDVTEKVLATFNSHDGFIKQYNASDFVACISSKALQDMMDSNFEILDRVREIHTVNRIPVTLSIGIVKSDESFNRQYEEAQVALDLALGRGGDQAIVRLGKDVKAFGGKAPASVSSTRVRVRVVAQALREIINEADMVLIMGHAHEDFDALGAAVGVSHLARVSKVEAHIVISKQDDTSKRMIQAIQSSDLAEGLLIDENKAKNLVTDKTVVIVVDTKSFTVQTSVRTFDAASYLRRCGADTALVKKLFSMDLASIKIKSMILADMKQVDEYMAFAVCPEGTADSQIIAGQVADFLVTVQKIRCSFLFYYTENGLCLSARSDGSVNVQIVMEQLGGGGHQTVAGAQFGTDGNIEDITKAVVANVRKQTEEEKE